MRPAGTPVCAAIVAVLVAVLLAGAQVALAVFTRTAAGGPMTVATSTLSPATAVEANQVNCRTNKSPEVEVSWSASSSGYATSYAVERATSSNGSYTSLGSVSASATSYLDKSGSLGYSTTYYYRVTVAYRSWSVASSADSVKTLGRYCV